MNSDLYSCIFVKVGEKDLYNLRCSCKYFCNIIDTKYFWINKILHKFPVLANKITSTDYKKHYYSLCKTFIEENLHYISAIAQEFEENDVLTILSAQKDFQHAKKIINVYNNNNIKEIYFINPYGLKEGRYASYYKNRKIKEVSVYKNGKKTDFCLLKGEEGDLVEFSYYKEGLKHGKCTYFHDIVEIKCYYNMGELHGKLESFINKEIFEEIYYINNTQTGSYKRYYYNGVLKEKGNYKDDLKHGNWTYYDLHGNIISEVTYDNDLFDFL